jgi:hypothetical protein
MKKHNIDVRGKRMKPEIGQNESPLHNSPY